MSFITPQAEGAGFEIKTWNAESLGQANAGSSVQTGNVEYMTRNPALLAQLNHYQASASLAGVFPSIKFKNSGSTLTGTNTNIQGGNGGDAGGNVAVPALYLGLPYNNKLKFGIAATVPWGLKTSYASGWVGRYWNLDSSMKTININPAVAYKFDEQWAIGAGVQLQYMDVKITRAIDTPTAIDTAISQAPPLAQGPLRGAATASGLQPLGNSANDIRARFRGDDWALGITAGLTYQPFSSTKLGISYRSQIDHKLRGSRAFMVPSATSTALTNFSVIGAAAGAGAIVNALTPRITDSNIKSSISTPQNIMLGASHTFAREWTILGEVIWTQWSRLKEIRIQTTTLSGVPDDVTTFRWQDTWSGSLGLNYRPFALPGWVFRTGVAYDPTPVKANYRIPAIPDNDRFWVAAGVGYELYENWKLSLSYAHEFIRDATSALRPAVGSSDAIRGQLNGKYKGSVNIVAAQFVYKF
jgi:long-chain fatty acid transport protein